MLTSQKLPGKVMMRTACQKEGLMGTTNIYFKAGQKVFTTTLLSLNKHLAYITESPEIII